LRISKFFLQITDPAANIFNYFSHKNVKLLGKIRVQLRGRIFLRRTLHSVECLEYILDITLLFL
jgi:hypothetical protein